ncbi:MAG: hypothetical protein K9H26_06200 [Prolixibacteraceae bacterium]|nr:hypothetical protein [Prolixibacteraceae bacterium]
MSTKPKQEPVDEETRIILDHLYSNAPTTMRLPNGETTVVPETGNIGLMAAGYRGILAWRKIREEKYGKRIFSPLAEIFKRYKEMTNKNREPDKKKPADE